MGVGGSRSTGYASERDTEVSRVPTKGQTCVRSWEWRDETLRPGPPPWGSCRVEEVVLDNKELLKSQAEEEMREELWVLLTRHLN